MKNIQKTMAAMIMVAVLMVGTTFAKDGLLLSDFAGGGQGTCQQSANDNGGIIVGNFVGIIVAGFTGIIVGNLNSSNEGSRNQVACRGGLLLSD